MRNREKEVTRRDEKGWKGKEGFRKPAAREFFLFSVSFFICLCALRQRRFRRQNIVKCPGSRKMSWRVREGK